MRSLNKAYFVCLAAAIVASGCANSEELSGRRPVEAKDIGGTSYASDAANEANLFGEEGSGLSSNPASKPSSALMGEYVETLGPVLLDVQPTDAEMFINSVMEFEIQVTKDPEDKDTTAHRDPVTKTQLVIVLESGDKDANASLGFTDGKDGTLVEEYSSKLVIHPNADGKAKFRVSSGTIFNSKKPMYYINVWSANADGYGTVKLYVKAPPQKEDYDKYEGEKVVNNLSQPENMTSTAAKAEMTTILDGNQQLFVDETKQLGVQLNIVPEGASGANADKFVPGAGEAVCWNFVGGKDGDSKIGYAMGDDGMAAEGCGVADDKGRFFVTVNTGKYYDAEYFLNFYHAVASPVTYDIKTFVMPNTLGTKGEDVGADLDGDGKPDEGLKLDVTAEVCKDKNGKKVSEPDEKGKCPDGSTKETIDAAELIDSGTGKGPSGNPEISPEVTQKLLDEIAGGIIIDPKTGLPETDIKDNNLNKIVTENCYVPDANGTFVCTLQKDSNGNWQLWMPPYCTDPDTGAVTKILIDPTDSCGSNTNQNGETVEEEKHPTTPVLTDADGDGVIDTIAITTETTCDDNGNNCETAYTGIDTNGDGKPDILPDPCTANPKAEGCSHVIEDFKNGGGSGSDGKPTDDEYADIITQICLENPKAALCESAKDQAEKDKEEADKDGKECTTPACKAVDQLEDVIEGLQACLKDPDSEACKNAAKDDGSGTVDNIQDEVKECLKNPNSEACQNSKYVKRKLLCLNHNTKKYTSTCPPVETKIDENVETGIKYVFIDGDDRDDNDVVVPNADVTWTLTRAFGSQNNAKLVSGSSKTGTVKPTSETELKNASDSDGLASATMNSGTAHSISYPLRVEGNDTHPVFQSIRVNYSVDIPTNKGDSPSIADLEKAESTPPADMPATDPNVGWVELTAVGAPSFTTMVVETLYLKAKVNKVDKDGKLTGTTFRDTKVYWKFVKGPSVNNNATLKYSDVVSDDNGIAQNEFYSGTGYDTTYFAIAYHPNFVERDEKTGKPKTDDKGNIIYKHLTFSMRVADFGGNNGGIVPPVIEEKVEKCEEEYDGIDHMDSDGTIRQWGTKCVYTCIVNGVDVGYSTEAECRGKYENESGDKIDIGGKDDPDDPVNPDDHDKVDPNTLDPKLPKGLCQIDEDKIKDKCNICAESNDEADCPTECKPYFGVGVRGCLYFSIDGDPLREAEINSSVKLRATVKKYDGTDVLNADNVEVKWALGKSESSNASLAMMRQYTDKGVVDNKLSTGASTGKLVVEARTPNAFTCDSKNNCTYEDRTVIVHVNNSIIEEGDNAPLNKLNVQVGVDSAADLDDSRISLVEYYVASSDAHNCDSNFPKLDKKARQQAFNELSKDRNDKQSETVSYSSDNQAAHTFSIKDPREKQLVYAIATDASGNTVGYACEEDLAFKIQKSLPSICSELREQCEDGSNKSEDCEEFHASCTNEINATLKLTGVPVEIAPQYQTRTVFDLGAIVAKGKDEEECDAAANNCSPVVKYMRVVTDAYQKYVGSEGKTVGDTLVSFLFDRLLIESPGTNAAKSCAAILCGGNPNGYGLDMICKSTCADTDSKCQSEEQESGKRYKDCSCVCGKFHYFAKYWKVKILGYEIPVIEKIREPAKKALVSLVDSALGTDELSVEQLVCTVFDAVQFIEFTGTVDLAKEAGKSTYGGKFTYTGIVPPKVFGVELDSQLSMVKGVWDEASLVNDKDLLAFKKMKLNFSYGNLLYDILNKFVVHGPEGDVLNFINCESIFSKDLSIPIVGGFKADDMQKLCNSVKDTLNGEAVNLADSQSISLNIVADGQAKLEGESENVAGKIYAQNIVQGQWDGTGVVRGENYNISGLWYASRNSDGLAELNYDFSEDAGVSSLDAWKAARSICRGNIDASRKNDIIKNADKITNQLCLGGTFDAAARESGNLCSNSRCNDNASVVVCNGKKLNPDYATAEKDAIIAAAKLNCYKEAVVNESPSAKTACDSNPEVTGYDNAATNLACYNDGQCSGKEIAACADYANNKSLVVCGANAKCQGKDGYDEDCVKREASNNCKGHCDDADCAANIADAIICAPRSSRELATWTTFDNGQSKNPYYNSGTGKMTDQAQFQKDIVYGLYPDHASKYNALFMAPGIPEKDIKIITGTDGKLGAIGIAKLGDNSIKIEFKTKRKNIVDNPSVDTDYYCSKYNVLFSIMGGGRKLKIDWGDGSAEKVVTTKDSFQVYGPSSKDKRAFYNGDTITISLADKNTESDGMPMLRIDDIKLTAECIDGYEKYINRDGSGSGSGSSTGGTGDNKPDPDQDPKN